MNKAKKHPNIISIEIIFRFFSPTVFHFLACISSLWFIFLLGLSGGNGLGSAGVSPCSETQTAVGLNNF